MDAVASSLIEQNTRQIHNAIVHDTDYLVFRHLIDPTGLFADIGANRGQSAISYRVLCPNAPVISFEANPLFTPVLEHLQQQLTQYSYHITALGDKRDDTEFLLPIVDGRPYLEEASIEPSSFAKPWVQDRLASYGSQLVFERQMVSVAVFDDFRLQPAVVKVDVEGAEAAVLRGMDHTIRECTPLFLVENSDWHNVTAFFTERGYVSYMYDAGSDQIAHFSGIRTNTLYVWSGSWPFRIAKPV